jgi:hypothetical protein
MWKEVEMITFILLVVFALLGIGFAVVSYSANQRRRAGQSGMDAVRNQHVDRPRATPPDV